jgi:hypothetical protein
MRLRRSLIGVVLLAAVAASPGTVVAAPDRKDVSFGGVTVTVPMGWPVVDGRPRTSTATATVILFIFVARITRSCGCRTATARSR